MLKRTLYEPEQLDDLPPGSVIRWLRRMDAVGLQYYKRLDGHWYYFPDGTISIDSKDFFCSRISVTQLEA